MTARTLVIGGATDEYFGDNLARMARGITDASVCLLPEQSHMAPMVRASVFRGKIGAFRSR